MSINELLGTGGGVLVLILCLIQISPIKLNPWSAIAKALGRAINGEMIGELKTVAARVDQNEIDRLRWEILEFSNSCQQGRRHTKEEFDHIIDMHQKYERILKRTDGQNGQVSLAYTYIIELYHRCQQEHDFL